MSQAYALLSKNNNFDYFRKYKFEESKKNFTIKFSLK